MSGVVAWATATAHCCLLLPNTTTYDLNVSLLTTTTYYYYYCVLLELTTTYYYLQVLIYGVLDVISKAVFGLILMSGASTGYEAI